MSNARFSRTLVMLLVSMFFCWLPITASAEVILNERDVTNSWTEPANECIPEDLDVELTSHELLIGLRNGDLIFRASATGYAVGQDSGNIWKWHNPFLGSLKVPREGNVQFTIVDRSIVVGKGDLPNFHVNSHWVIRVIEGLPVVEITGVEIRCLP